MPRSDTGQRPASILPATSRPVQVIQPACRLLPGGLLAAAAWVAAAALMLPAGHDELERTALLAGSPAGLGRLLAGGPAASASADPAKAGRRRALAGRAGGRLAAWELVTAKFDLLPRPFFASPQAILEVFTDDWPRLGDSCCTRCGCCRAAMSSAPLLGFILGVAIGWSRAVGYWVHPVLRLIGPLPATAWLPLAFFVFPSQPQRQHLPDRAGHRFPGHGADLVGRRRRQQGLLRRRPDAWAPASASWS